MAFGRGRGSDDFSTGLTPVPTSNESGGLTAFIDQGSSFEGKLSFKDTVRIDGHFSGQITSENTLVIGESGVIEADIRSQIVIVSGTIHVRGQTTDFVQTVDELALDGASVAEGAPPQQIGVRLAQRARAGDRVFRVSW